MGLLITLGAIVAGCSTGGTGSTATPPAAQSLAAQSAAAQSASAPTEPPPSSAASDRVAPRPSATPETPSSCGHLATFVVDGVEHAIGPCAATLSETPAGTTLLAGQTVELRLLQEQDAAGRLVPVLPVPVSSNPQVLALVSTSDGGAVADYRAQTAGSATLYVTTPSCLAIKTMAETTGRCPLLAVTVQ